MQLRSVANGAFFLGTVSLPNRYRKNATQLHLGANNRGRIKEWQQR